MKDIALLVGNGVNSLSSGLSWNQLLANIIAYCDCPDLKPHDSKPFPLFYEEIFLTSIKRGTIRKERDLKKFIAGEVRKITPNDVHLMIRALKPAHIMTVNYEYLLQGSEPAANDGLIQETTYSIFRRYRMNDITYWHLHGDCNNPTSINLGYEHYGGQLQKMRNYITAIPDYKGDQIEKMSLARRLKHGALNDIQSWIDLFFVKDVHIVGLNLDFVETDLWWLLTYRARQQQYKKEFAVNNRVVYYIPKKFEMGAEFKLNVLKANGVEIEVIDKPHDLTYYREIFGRL
jgi:hypothetical protein